MIKFGTSGWRDIIAKGFTYDRVYCAAQAICDYLIGLQETVPACGTVHYGDTRGEIIVGYDTRFMSEDFAKAASEVFAANGFKVSYSSEDVPTPTIAYEIIRKKARGGINITASHNPYMYSGLKFSPAWGGPALPETTKQIEINCNEIQNDTSRINRVPFNEAVKKKMIIVRSFKKTYLKRVSQLINFDAIRKSKIKIAVDVMHGAGRGYLGEILKQHKIPYAIVHENRDCMFGGHHPEPAEVYLTEIIKMVKSKKFRLGIASDGDADRFGIIDSDGSYISANEVIALLANHLAKTRKWKGIIARSVMTSSFIDAVAGKWGLELRETPVGFKYIGDILVKESLVIGGEESGGLTIKGHVPEKDGIVACLLAVEMAAMEKKSIKKILNDLQKEVGIFYSERTNLRLDQTVMDSLRERLMTFEPSVIAGNKVKKVNRLDGFKVECENGDWLGIRLSGTEPIVRCYIESRSKQGLSKLLKAGKEIIYK
ncbi:MAG: phosphoglucomutase/phosphomannomutase family protein [Elusimicrobiota bacterium]